MSSPARALTLVVVLFAAGALSAPGSADARGGARMGGGRMAVSSVGTANRAAGVANRPAQLPAGETGASRPSRPGDGGNRPERDGYEGWGWYDLEMYDTDDRGDWDIEVEERNAAIAAAAAAAVAATPPPPPPTVGTVLYALPPGCSTVAAGGKYLRQCGGVHYEERFEGDRLAYVVVTP